VTKVVLWATFVAALLLAGLGAWWYTRPMPLADRLDLIGPGTQAYVSFLADGDDKALRDLLDSLKSRTAAGPQDSRSEWLRALGENLTGAALDRVRATGLVETLGEGQSEVVIVVSLGRMAKVVAKMWFGISGSERELETYRKVRILLGRDRQDLSMAFVGNNLVMSRDPGAIHLLIDRLLDGAPSAGPSNAMRSFLRDIEPRQAMPGQGALVNDRASLASLWQMATGAPRGAEIELPADFEGMGFRFGFRSADVIHGDGYMYFTDEEAAAGGVPLLDEAIPKLFRHYGFDAKSEIEQQGRRLHVAVTGTGLQKAIDRYFVKAKPAAG